MKPLYDPEYDPLWEVCQDLEVPVNVHGGTGAPDYGHYPVSMLLYITEVGFYSQRPFVHMLLSGVFERFPRLKFVMTETGCAWVPPLLARLDATIRGIRDTGATGEIRYGEDHVLPRDATEYFHQNCWMGVSQPGDADVDGAQRARRSTASCGAATTRTTRARSRTPASTCGRGSTTCRRPSCADLLAGNAAKLYDFDLKKLAPLAAKFGPTVDEIADADRRDPDKTLERLSGDMDPKAIK